MRIIIYIAFLILISIIVYKKQNKYEKYNTLAPVISLSDKVVILCSTQKHINDKNKYGLGDMIRGYIGMYQLSKKYNFKLIIDISLHPISKYLITKSHEYSNLIENNKDNIIFDKDSEKFILNNKNNIIIFDTNYTINHKKLYKNISDDCRKYIKDILTPNDEMQQYISEHMSHISNIDYNILHYRLGDKEKNYWSKYIRNIIKDNNYDIYIDSVLKNKEENDILMSDSIEFKELIKENTDIYMFDLDIGHIGTDNDDKLIKNTLLEFFIMTRANKIKTFSNYTWVSNFVLWASYIYNIPLIQITL
jgi:hypothetical protein